MSLPRAAKRGGVEPNKRERTLHWLEPVFTKGEVRAGVDAGGLN